MASVTAKPPRAERFSLSMDGGERQESQGSSSKATAIGPHVPSLAVPPRASQSPEHLREAWNTLRLLLSCSCVWITCAFIDAIYTPRDASYIPSRSLIISYQWCMVGYASNLILTLMKVIFETNRSKLKLHMVSCYINTLAATSYAMLWTGFSPIVPDVQSCLYIPQRWMLYCFTAPAIIYILCQISDYTHRMRVWVIMLNVFMLAAGGLGTVPWISWTHKVFWYVMSCVPFPSILVHMWRMVSSAVDETMDPTSKRAIKFIRLFSITTWNLFPFVYFAAIDGALSLEISEPLWAALDWLTKMVYSSSLMEANFFTIAQRREFAVRAIEEANRLATIQQLSTAIERKDDFLSAMSHELRTPLNGIIGLSESLMAGACGQLPEKAVKTVSTVKLSGKRLLQLINDILDAAKMKQGTLVIKHEKVDIKRLVTDVLDLSLPLVRKGVRLVNNVGNVPKIVGDNGRIVQILYNLVGNAAKFTRQGVISITAGVSEDNTKVYVTVSDTGVGIPKEKVPKIFGAFEQADMSTTRRYGGTGLGLHLVKELVKAHCGDITVESEVGVGSSFTIWLPISQDGAVMAMDETDAREQYALDLDQPLRRISEESEEGASYHPAVHRLEDTSDEQDEGGDGVAGDSDNDADGGGGAGLRKRRGAAVNRGAAVRGGHGRGGASVATARSNSDNGANDGGGAGGGSGGAGGRNEVRRSTGGSSSAGGAGTGMENLITVTKTGFKVMKPFYREKYGGCMVLSVDDDPINQMVVENLLSPEGYKVEQAMSGSEALDFLKKTATLPDVILLDIMMPDMSGYEVCQEIRRRYSAVSIPIIMVSAKGHPEHVMKGLEAGSVDYVKKPFHRQELLSRIRAQVRNREIFEAEMESRKVTEMLKRILPLSVIQRLQQGQSMIADAHDEVTVLFADVAGWLSNQSLSSRNTTDVVLVLNEMYGAFEKLLLKYQVFRVEHTGESYLVVSGHDGTGDHINRVLSMAVDMLSAVQQLTFPGGEALTIRIGVHTGPAYAGVVGIDNPRYCVFGDTVSVANALEAKGFDNAIHCSNAIYAAVRSKERDRGSAKFIPGRKSMATGSAVMDTFIFKAGSWEAAMKQLEEEEREKEVLERESKQAEEAGSKDVEKEGDKEDMEQAKARAEALEAQVVTLETERDAAEVRAQAEAAEKRLAVEKLAVEKAEKTAARAQVDLLRNRAEAAEAERQKLKESMASYERLLAEAREAVAAAAAHSATNGSRGGGGTVGQPLVSFHHPHGAAAAAAAATATATAERDLLFSPEGSVAPSDFFSASVAGSIARGPGSVVAGQVSQSFWSMTYPIEMFLRDIGLPQYVERMRSQEVTPLVLASMKEKELEALGVETLGARRRIVEAARQYAVKVKSTAKMVAMYRDGQTLGGGAPGLPPLSTTTSQPPHATGGLLPPGPPGLRPLLARETSGAEAAGPASGTGGMYGLVGTVQQVIDLLQ